MAIKVTVGEQKPQNSKPFPKLMKSKEGRIVFMISYGHGFQLNYALKEGPHFCRNWCMDDFTEYNEPVTLQNEV